MNILVVLISISLFIAMVFLGAFLWSLKSGQFDDTYGPSVRILFDDKKKKGHDKEIKKVGQTKN